MKNVPPNEKNVPQMKNVPPDEKNVPLNQKIKIVPIKI